MSKDKWIFIIKEEIIIKTFTKTLTLSLVLASLGCTLSACDQKDTPTNDTMITVTDMVGDTVTMKANPKKVACVSRTTYDLLIAFGLGDKIDGAYKGTLNNPWVKEIYPASANHFVYGYQDSYETFISRGVDLVFAPEKYIADDLREHGINALCVSLYGTPSFDSYVHYFSDLTTKLWTDPSVKTKANKWNEKVDTAISTIKTELESKNLPKQKKVFYVRGDKDKGIGYTDTVCSFTEYAYRVLGFDYVGSTLDTNKPSKETVVASNPDIFVCGGIYQNLNMQRLHEEPYANLDAVKNNKIYNIPIGFTAFEQLSAMTPIFFYDQANKIYPEYFNFDIESMVKETMLEYFSYSITDEKVNYMLHGLDPLGNALVNAKA